MEKHIYTVIMRFCLNIFLFLSFSFPALSSAQDSLSTSVPLTSPEAPQDATYIIKPGDTLWDLAFHFLSDPFKWPLIWNANPYIKNPDLIYPGNSLRIPGRNESFAGQKPIDTNAEPVMVSQTRGAIMESASIRDSLEKAAPYNQDSLILSAIRMRNPLSAAFFAAVPFLWTEKDPSGYIYPGNAIVDKPVSQVSYQRFERISIKPQKGASYKVGDTVDVFSPIRFVRFNSSISNLVKRVARARVIEAGPKRIHAELFEMSDPVKGKERIALSTPFTPKEIDTLVEPEVVIGAEVFTRVEGTVRAYPFQTLILNRGEADGVLLGDVFAVYHKDRPVNNPSFAGIGYVAHLNSNSCSMVIVNLSGEKIEEGDRAALIRRARFRGIDG